MWAQRLQSHPSYSTLVYESQSSSVRSPPAHTAASLAARVSTAAAATTRAKLEVSRTPSVSLAAAASVIGSIDVLRSYRPKETAIKHASSTSCCECLERASLLPVIDALATEVLSQQDLIASLLRRLARYEPVPPSSDLDRDNLQGARAHAPGGAKQGAGASGPLDRANSMEYTTPLDRARTRTAASAALDCSVSPIKLMRGSPVAAEGAHDRGRAREAHPIDGEASERCTTGTIEDGAGTATPARGPGDGSGVDASAAEHSRSFASIAAAARRRAAAAHARRMPKEVAADAGRKSVDKAEEGGDIVGDADAAAEFTRLSHELLTAGLRLRRAGDARFESPHTVSGMESVVLSASTPQ